MKRTTLFTVVFMLLLSISLSGCSGSQERSWQSGQKALAEGKYTDAVTAFKKAGSHSDAGRLLQYAEAMQALEAGNYDAATAGFQVLGDFKDCVLMDSYSRARKQEDLAQAALSRQNADEAVQAGMEAYVLYSGLSLFRDSDARAAACRELLYTNASEWMSLGRFDAAAAAFAALSGWQDSAVLQKYCEASALEQQGSYLEAAEVFNEIADSMDAGARASAALDRAYQLAVERKDAGDYEAAAAGFGALGDYRDAAQQRDNVIVGMIREQLHVGAFHEALVKLNQLTDRSAFPSVDSSAGESYDIFLNGFVGAWMNAHAGVMNAFFSCNLLQPYLDPGGELDSMIREEITDETAPVNYGFLFQRADVKELLVLDEGSIAALAHGTASYSGPEGPVDMDETLWVLLDISRGNPIAAAVLPR